MVLTSVNSTKEDLKSIKEEVRITNDKLEKIGERLRDQQEAIDFMIYSDSSFRRFMQHKISK